MRSREDFIFIINRTLSNKCFINYYVSEDIGFSVSFEEINKIADSVSRLLSNLTSEQFQFIGVALSSYLWLPSLLLSIWKSGNACACIGTQYQEEHNIHFLNTLKTAYLITDNETLYNTDILVDSFHINNQQFYIIKRIPYVGLPASGNFIDMCYGIMTSGTTATPKIVRVPWSCILPNVCDLINILSVNENDNIYLSSPCTFDPFFVEIFLFIITGCSLTIVDSDLKLCFNSLTKIFFEKREYPYQQSIKKITGDTSFFCETSKIHSPLITIIQMTPSIFGKWGMIEIKNIILSDSTSLRVLLLGGEKFPTYLLKWKSEKNRTKIYNIYGITEISCWAFINELCEYCDDVSLGKPLSSIVYKIDENNELLLGSNTRICILDGDPEIGNLSGKSVVFRRTGDIVRTENDSIYYMGRTNQMVKKFGIKINLEKIENCFLEMQQHNINICYTLFHEECMKVVLFYVNKNLKDDYCIVDGWQGKFKSKVCLKSIEVPDYVIEIPKIPLNVNGKCDKHALLKLFKQIVQKENSKVDIDNVFKNVWQAYVGGENYLNSGGDSITALQIITKLEENRIKVPKNFLKTLLEDGSYDGCLKCLALDENSGSSSKRIKLSFSEEILKFSVIWTFNTKKCVDASPTVYNYNGKTLTTVGSHSTKLSTVKIDTGQVHWTIKLGDRIESEFSVNKSSTFGIIGCYDEYVYSISISNGEILWKYKTGGMIKSTPCLSSDEQTVYVASYDTYLYRLECRDGALKMKLKLGDRGIYSSGIISDKLNSFYIATLDGSCISVNQESDNIQWKHKLPNPVFSSPVLIDAGKNDGVIFTEVIGRINCLDARTGKQLWVYESNGYIYSTPVYSFSLKYLIFGCYDNHMYCLECNGQLLLRWKIQFDSPVFANPCFCSSLDDNLIAVSSTKGSIYLIQVATGKIRAHTKLGNEIFSSPKVIQNKLIVGCRDNNLYCLSFENIE